MSKRTLIILSVIIIICVGGFIGYTTWNKPFTNPLHADAIKVSSVQLFTDFSTNEAAAQKKYVPETVGGKVVEVSGEIKEIGKNDLGETYYYLKTNDEMSGVKCIMDKGDEIQNIKTGASVVIRGFCDGIKKDTMMDIVLMDVIINRCKPVK